MSFGFRREVIMITRALAVALLMLAATPAARAQADADEQARVQYKLGFELFEAGRFEQAAVALRKAYELKPSWKILYNLAQAENAADRFAAALDAYIRYLAYGGDEIPEARVKQVKAEIKRLNALVAMVEIRGGPAGAEVFVDRETKGRLPLEDPLFVDLGRREVVVEHDGGRILERVVTLAGGEKAVLEIDDVTETAAADPAMPGAVFAPGTVPEEEVEPEGGTRRWTWVALGVGLAAGAGVGITGGMALSRKNELEDACPGGECPPSRMDDLRSARALGNTATALTVVAGVAMATALVLWFVEPGIGREEQATAAGLSPLPGGAALTLGGRF